MGVLWSESRSFSDSECYIGSHSRRSSVHVSVVTERTSPSALEPSSQLYGRNSLALATGVAPALPHQPLKVLLANISIHDRFLKKDQVIGTMLPPPLSMAEMRAMSVEPNEDGSDHFNTEQST